MRHRVEISEAAYNAVLAKALPHELEFFGSSRKEEPNGNVSILLGEETIDKLNELRLKGEELSDVILRICGGKAN